MKCFVCIFLNIVTIKIRASGVGDRIPLALLYCHSIETKLCTETVFFQNVLVFDPLPFVYVLIAIV